MDAAYSANLLEVVGRGVIKSEGVIVDKDGNVFGVGRDRNVYKVAREGTVKIICTLPKGSIANGLAMDRERNTVFCDLGKHGVMRERKTVKSRWLPMAWTA